MSSVCAPALRPRALFSEVVLKRVTVALTRSFRKLKRRLNSWPSPVRGRRGLPVSSKRLAHDFVSIASGIYIIILSLFRDKWRERCHSLKKWYDVSLIIMHDLGRYVP